MGSVLCMLGGEEEDVWLEQAIRDGQEQEEEPSANR